MFPYGAVTYQLTKHGAGVVEGGFGFRLFGGGVGGLLGFPALVNAGEAPAGAVHGATNGPIVDEDINRIGVSVREDASSDPGTLVERLAKGDFSRGTIGLKWFTGHGISVDDQFDFYGLVAGQARGGVQGKDARGSM